MLLGFLCARFAAHFFHVFAQRLHWLHCVKPLRDMALPADGKEAKIQVGAVLGFSPPRDSNDCVAW
jgi:hypothetical protein